MQVDQLEERLWTMVRGADEKFHRKLEACRNVSRHTDMSYRQALERMINQMQTGER